MKQTSSKLSEQGSSVCLKIKQQPESAPWPDSMRWRDLEELIKIIRIRSKECVYKLSYIEKNPITPQTIENLIKDGWKVFQEGIYNLCIRESKKIYISGPVSRGSGFQRDATLFHELVHAHYDFLKDARFCPQGFENNAIIDWSARQLRANPALLRHAVRAFGLKPRIYDRSSYLAFYGGEQLSFKFAEKYMKRLTKTRMD